MLLHETCLRSEAKTHFSLGALSPERQLSGVLLTRGYVRCWGWFGADSWFRACERHGLGGLLPDRFRISFVLLSANRRLSRKRGIAIKPAGGEAVMQGADRCMIAGQAHRGASERET